ncbi:MAG: tRNA pseudouridine(13) synthase TruD [Methanocalculaceae archaeon]|jgi:tRNA pseudouridine13 synthase|nr:tRNA pseudouridine(13) synthase TruD [Methanocalculaceae archaeon]
MKPSDHPLEQALGMQYYATGTDGIGGVLRSTPEDFKVVELPAKFTGTGPYLIAKLTKRSWEHQHAMREIARRLAISHRRIGWGGTKDRNAITTQYISLYGVAEEQLAALSIRDITLQPTDRHQFSLGLGSLEGNRFVIMLRNCNADSLTDRVAAITQDIRTSGIPNYYGIQRFGSLKPVTHRVGLHILRGEYQEAVKLYIGDAFPQESGEVKTMRRAFAETGNAKAALHDLPVQLSYERIMLDSLAKQPGDYGHALQAMPPKLLSLFISAYQSWLFNMALSARCTAGASLDNPAVGEHLLFTNGRIDTVTEKNIHTASQHIKRGSCTVVAWMPGATLPVTPGPMERDMICLMEKDDVTMQNFADASAFTGTCFDGAHRKIILRTEVVYSITETSVCLSFDLPPGHYATTVCREYMQGSPEQMV